MFGGWALGVRCWLIRGAGEGSKSRGGPRLVCPRSRDGLPDRDGGRGPATATAPAGPERHWRKRRGPPAGDGLGNRGAIRARLPCTDREHGGTRAVSRRTGSPREPRSEGPRALLQQNQPPRGIFCRRRMTARAGEGSGHRGKTLTRGKRGDEDRDSTGPEEHHHRV